MSVVDVLFPRFCFGCGFVGSYLCLSCESKLVPLEARCFYCQKKSCLGLTHAQCRKKGGIDGFISLFKYNNTFKSILKKIKYALVKDSINEIFPLLLKSASGPLSFYRKTYQDLCLQPVPLHFKKENKRGFNQSKIICAYISQLFSIKTITIARRTIDTPSQAELFLSKERVRNIRGAFSVDLEGQILPSAIIIADDIVTTGSTVCELVRTLKQKSDFQAIVFSLAKG